MKTMEPFDITACPLEGANLIEASAGTGKTHAIEGLFLRLIVERTIRVTDILVVTFTEAATKELRGRIRKRLRRCYHSFTGQEPDKPDHLVDHLTLNYKDDEAALLNLRDALRDFDEAPIYTIHGFCRRILMENAFESGALFDVNFEGDDSNLVREAAEDFWRRNFYEAPPAAVDYAGHKKLGPGKFEEMGRRIPLVPPSRIEPHHDEPDTAALREAVERVERSFAGVREIWPAVRDEVRAMLLEHRENGSLSGIQYKTGTISGLIDAMDRAVRLPFVSLSLLEELEKLGSARLASSCNKGKKPPRHDFFDRMQSAIDQAGQAAVFMDRYHLSLKGSCIGDFFDRLAEKKVRRNIMSFNDLLIRTRDALRGDPDGILAAAARKRYRVALIDEFQDTDPVQCEIFTVIFGGGRSTLFLIGDPKQSIYGFRGADIFAYIRASRGADKKFTMDTNWRSDMKLISAVNTLFSRNPNPFLFGDVRFHPVAAPAGKTDDPGMPDVPLRIWYLGGEHADRKDGTVSRGAAHGLINRAVAAEISSLVNHGNEVTVEGRPVAPGDIAVLVRSHYQAGNLYTRLRLLGIPAVRYGLVSVFETREAADIQRLLEAAAVPGNHGLVKAALLSDMFDVTGGKLFDLMDDEKQWEKLTERFYGYHDLWARRGFMRMFRSMLEMEHIHSTVLSLPDGERIMTNLLHLAEILHREERSRALGMGTMIAWLREKRARPDQTDEYQIRLETDEQAVKIYTLHKSKGLDFPIVFCPFLDNGALLDARNRPPFLLFHDPENFQTVLDIDSENPDNQHVFQMEQMAENLRLMYVGLTRAKNMVYTAWGKINGAGTSAPAWLFHRPPETDNIDIPGTMDAHYKTMQPPEIKRDLEDMAADSGGNMMIEPIPDNDGIQYSGRETAGKVLKCREFSGTITGGWRISSFSSMIRPAGDAGAGRDYDTDVSGAPSGGDVTDGDIFSFPRGSLAGQCIHEIFEKTDFTAAGTPRHRDDLGKIIARYGFGDRWGDVMMNMVNCVTAVTLEGDSDSLRLSDISWNDRLTELEFYFPLDTVSPSILSEVFMQTGRKDAVREYAGLMAELGEEPVRGFMRGFIDLVVRSGERYYIIDWKSNHLGNSSRDYDRISLEAAMRNHHYILQYHIYVLALHRFLKMRMPGSYRYDKNFGGVFYLFVRGIDSKSNGNYGIYYDMPDTELVGSLEEAVCRRGCG